MIIVYPYLCRRCFESCGRSNSRSFTLRPPALHHDNASLAVKTVYALGYLVWLVSGRYVAPGCLILARKEPT